MPYSVVTAQQACSTEMVKAKNVGNIQRYTSITLCPTAPLYNLIIIFYTVLLGRNEIKKKNETVLIQQCRVAISLSTLACDVSPATGRHTETVRNLKIALPE